MPPFGRTLFFRAGADPLGEIVDSTKAVYERVRAVKRPVAVWNQHASESGRILPERQRSLAHKLCSGTLGLTVRARSLLAMQGERATVTLDEPAADMHCQAAEKLQSARGVVLQDKHQPLARDPNHGRGRGALG